MSISDDAVVVDFQAIRPDGCVSLEINETLADIQKKGLTLTDGQTLPVWAAWGEEIHAAEGVVKWDDTWGWGLQVDKEILDRFGPR